MNQTHYTAILTGPATTGAGEEVMMPYNADGTPRREYAHTNGLTYRLIGNTLAEHHVFDYMAIGETDTPSDPDVH